MCELCAILPADDTSDPSVRPCEDFQVRLRSVLLVGAAAEALVIVNSRATTDRDRIGAKRPHRARRPAKSKIVVRRANCADEGRTAAVSPVRGGCLNECCLARIQNAR